MTVKNLELLVATHNRGKIDEYKSLFGSSAVNFKTAMELDVPEPEEIGKTFSENALIKAKNAAEYTGMLSLGEDSGLVVNALGDFPGIRTGRWTKSMGGNIKAFKVLEEKLNGLPNDASFQCSIVLFCPREGLVQEFFESVKGTLDFSFEDGTGFGYDPIFVPKGFDKTFSQLGMSVKNKISHRSKCFRKLIKFLDHYNNVR